MEDSAFPKVSSHSQKEDISIVERTEDDKSWMELSFVDDDGNEKSIADLSMSARPPDSVSLDALAIEDDVSLSSGELNDTPKAAAEQQKPAKEEEEAKPTSSRTRPKKTKTHRKTKSFDDRILIDSDITKKKKKKKDKKGKGDSGDLPAKSKRKQKKRSSAGKESSDGNTDEALLGGENSSDDQSLMSNQSSATSAKSSKRRGLRSLSPVRIRNPLRGAGLMRQLSGKGGSLMGRAKDLKDQLIMSDHVPGERKGIMGAVLYSSFDNDDDSDLDGDDFFS
ncbi:unnamed protein product [Cylindrotheca closterium]|uniref:Uncharacterized protein n=1 Tax=Cylindrotheca closterium TaxID=2856 RepID=A0AAD2CBL2_9STRA|nr:unnamed protein product [Cylindrotheca closterium]